MDELLTVWFEPLSSSGECCDSFFCHNEAAWAIVGSEARLCRSCMYGALEEMNNDESISPQALAPLVHAYVKGLLPGHYERCPSCAAASSVEEVVSCLLSEELLAPFVDGVYVTPASLASVVQAFLVGA